MNPEETPAHNLDFRKTQVSYLHHLWSRIAPGFSAGDPEDLESETPAWIKALTDKVRGMVEKVHRHKGKGQNHIHESEGLLGRMFGGNGSITERIGDAFASVINRHPKQ